MDIVIKKIYICFSHQMANLKIDLVEKVDIAVPRTDEVSVKFSVLRDTEPEKI